MRTPRSEPFHVANRPTLIRAGGRLGDRTVDKYHPASHSQQGDDRRHFLRWLDPFQHKDDSDGHHADERRRQIPLADIGDPVDDLGQMVGARRIVAGKVAQLADDDQQGGTHDKAGHDRVRDKADQSAQPEQATFSSSLIWTPPLAIAPLIATIAYGD